MKKNEDSKQKILKSATKLFAKRGYDATSIREICKDADVNLCMISYYWGGKKELYQGIIDGLIERQIEYVNTFADINKSPYDMTQDERVNLLYTWLDKFIDLFYSDFISKETVTILLREQQNSDFAIKSPVFTYFRTLIGAILNKDKNDKETIFKTLFIISQMNSPRVLTMFSLRLLNQDKFNGDDIKIIKDNIKHYVKNLIKESELR